MRLIDADELKIKLGTRYGKLISDVAFMSELTPYAVAAAFTHVDFEIENTPTVVEGRPKGKWIPIEIKESSPEEIRNGIPYLTLDCPIPSEGEHTLVTDGKNVWVDTWEYDEGWYLGDSDLDPLDIIAWMPLPKPYKLEEKLL